MNFSDSPVTLYGVFLLSYLLSQIYYSVRERKRQSKLKRISLNEHPIVTILVPFYNESIEEIKGTIKSLIDQDYPKERYEVLVMDDGSKSQTVYEELVSESFNGLVKIFRQENQGKRHAQYSLSKKMHIDTQYILTVDSDSELSPTCITELVKVAVEFGAKAVSGGILVKDQPGLLNKLLRVRYWLSNWQERMSQSWFNQVTCCSGPCTLWDASVFKKVRDEYIGQTFLGKQCTYGDDRHLTNLYLREDCKVKMADAAYCQTSTPETWKKWIKQQTRWSKSFYRESWWSFKNLRGKINWFFIYQNAMAFILPFLLIFNLVIYLAFYEINQLNLLFYAIAIFAAGLIRGLYAFSCTRDKTYFLAPIYGIIHFFLVFPVRVWAVTQLKDTRWGTR